MVFTQGRGFVLGASFGLPHRSLRCRIWVCHAADIASLATWFLFGKLLGVAMLVDFGEKRCRKKLPLADASHLEFKLSTGREVALTGFFIGATNTWIDHQQAALADKVLPVVRGVFPSGDFQFVGDSSLEFICVAGFNSTPLHDPDSYGSWLHLCWFVDDNDASIRDLVAAGLEHCDWDTYGHDIYFTPGS